MKPQTTPIKSAEEPEEMSHDEAKAFANSLKFGEVIINHWATDNNPIRELIFIKKTMFDGRPAIYTVATNGKNDGHFYISKGMKMSKTESCFALQTTAKEKEFCERLERQIAVLRTKADNCGDSTKEQRARKGAWIDAIVMFNELFKMYHPVCKHENITRSDGLDECLDCGARNY